MINKIKKLQNSLADGSAYLIISELHNFYLTGFKSTDGALLIDKNNAYLLVDSRYIEACELAVKHCKVVCFSRLFEGINEIIKSDNITTVYLEQDNLCVSASNAFCAKLEEAGVKAVSDNTLDKLLSELRLIKDENEKLKIQKAQEISEEAMLKTLEKLHKGMTEREFALELEYEMKKLGASEVSFDLITISGKKTSMPHGEPDESVIENNSFFTMDIGAVYDGYHSDMTRTVAIGEVNQKMCDIYSIVLEAQLTALEMVKAGVKCSDIDKAARDIITEAGYGDYFRHSTGHGVGIEIHENPGVSPSCDTVLEEGMVITIEPGIYLPGEFGVRIEDMVLVTKDGYHNFAKLPKELLGYELADK